MVFIDSFVTLQSNSRPVKGPACKWSSMFITLSYAAAFYAVFFLFCITMPAPANPVSRTPRR